MDTLDYIFTGYGLESKRNDPIIEIPGLTRNLFASLLYKLGFERGSEIGVEAGLYSEVLLQSNPNLMLHCIDSWKAYHGYRDHTSQDKMDELYRITLNRLNPYGRCFFHRGFSMDQVSKFEDNSLDFVYIDGNHEFRHVVDDICEWTKKVRPGGIVAGHDYIRRKGVGYLIHVIPAIHAYCDAYAIRPLFIMGRKQEDPAFRDRVRSWFFVKPTPPSIVPGSGSKALT